MLFFLSISIFLHFDKKKPYYTVLNDYRFIFYLFYRINNDLFLHFAFYIYIMRVRITTLMRTIKSMMTMMAGYRIELMMTKCLNKEHRKTKIRGNEWQITNNIFYFCVYCIYATWHAFGTTIIIGRASSLSWYHQKQFIYFRFLFVLLIPVFINLDRRDIGKIVPKYGTIKLMVFKYTTWFINTWRNYFHLLACVCICCFFFGGSPKLHT